MRKIARLNAFALFALLCSAASFIALPGTARAEMLEPAQSATPSIGPERIAAAKALLEATGAAKQFDAVVPVITQQLEAAFTKLKPEHAAEIKEAFGRIPEKFSSRKQELLDQIAVLYAQQLTAAELNEMTDFYKSPAGRKLVGVQGTLVQQSMVLGKAWGQKIGLEIQQEIRSELKQRGIEL